MNTCANLTRILNDRAVTVKLDALFLYEFQHSVLLALKECGTLTEIQLRLASEILKEQYLRNAAKCSIV